MKSLARFRFRLSMLASLLCSVALLANGASAQGEEVASSWVKVAPPSEAFTVLMPRMPFPVAERGASGGMEVEGQRYSLLHEDAEYMVWSFKGESFPATTGERETYLDRCAEIAWNLLIEPHWERLKGDPNAWAKYNLTYGMKLPASGHPGRIYRLKLDKRQGITHIYAAASQIYIVAAASAPREVAKVEAFIKSFRLNAPAPEVRAEPGASVAPVAGSGESVSGGAGGGAARETDYSRPFTAREVTQKARILTKPEPSYTEWARRFGVTGTVRLRIVLGSTGRVESISPVHRLPHGLTEEAIKAARRIQFTPATKDGRPVSQYVTFEYNFNIY